MGTAAPYGVYCAGYSASASPALWGGDPDSALGWVWSDEFAAVHVEDTSVVRTSNERAGVQFTGSGIQYAGESYAAGVDVVDATLSPILGGPGDEDICILTSGGEVGCVSSPNAPSIDMFPGAVVQAFAGNLDAAGLCAIYDDGSVWCRGDNAFGMFGVPDASLGAPTMVAGSGSARTGCQ